MKAQMTLTTDDINACAELVHTGDPDRFAAVMSAPVAGRRPLFVLYAFNLEVAKAAWASSEPMVGQMRLQFWRDVIEAAAGGGAVREHEVARPLAAVIREHNLPAEVLDAVVATRWWDLNREAFDDKAAFLTHLDASAGGLIWLAALALGAPGDVEQDVRAFGRAQGLASWFQAVPVLESKGRLPLADGRPAAIRSLAETSLADLRAARERLGRARTPWQAALRTSWQAEPLLKKVIRDPGIVARDGLGLSEFQKKRRLMRMVLLNQI